VSELTTVLEQYARAARAPASRGRALLKASRHPLYFLVSYPATRCKDVFAPLSGDHCYKTNESLPLEEQMISAMPDVRSVKLEAGDEFMVLACDGIWSV